MHKKMSVYFNYMDVETICWLIFLGLFLGILGWGSLCKAHKKESNNELLLGS